MKTLKFVPAFALAATLQLLAVGAFAQPDPNNAPKIDNPVNRPVGVGGRNRGGQILDAAALQRQMDERAKMQLQRAGITDPAHQNAILAYAQSERDAELKLREKGQELQRTTRTNTITDAQLITLINDYHAAIEEDKERHTKAVATLKTAIDFNKNPRVEAYLLLSGLYGDGPSITGNAGLGGRVLQLANAQGGGGQFGGPQGGGNGQFGAAQGANENNARGGNAQFGQFGAAQGVRPQAGLFGQFGAVQTQNNVAVVDGANAENTQRNRNGRNRRNNTPEAPAAPLAN